MTVRQPRLRTQRQTSLIQAIEVVGIGLHSGQPVTARLLPAPADHGIQFRRSDLPNAQPLPARFDQIVDTRLCTMLGEPGGARIGTVEHLMAALGALAIDNVLVEVDAAEVPVLDGSSLGWVEALQSAGRRTLTAPRTVLKVLAPFEWRDGARRIRLEPSSHLSLDVAIDFPHPAIGRQRIALDVTETGFTHDLAYARTFGFLHEAEALRRAGLGRGASLENAVVLAPDAVMNPGGLRAPDEFVRHKALDLIGDLMMAGAPLIAHVIAERPGHDATWRMLTALFQQPHLLATMTPAELIPAPPVLAAIA